MKKLLLCLSMLLLTPQPLKASEWRAYHDKWVLMNDDGTLNKGIIYYDNHYEWFDQQGQWIRTLNYPLLLSGYQALDQRVADILDELYDSSLTDWQQLMRIQTWIMQHASYQQHDTDRNRWGKYETDYEKIGIQLRLLDAAPILLDQLGVCRNYAALFYWLTRSLGYQSIIVTGTWQGQPHSWNAIYLNDWFFFDVTMADSTNDSLTYFMMKELPTSTIADDFDQSILLYSWQSYFDLEKLAIPIIRDKTAFIDYLMSHKNKQQLDFFYVGEPFCIDLATLTNKINISYLSVIPKASDAAMMLKGNMFQIRLINNQLYDQWLTKNQQDFCLLDK